MSTKKIWSKIFQSRKPLIVICSFAMVILIGLGCGAWIMSEEKEVVLSVNNNETVITTYANTLSDLLEEQSIELDDVTDSSADLRSALYDGQKVDVEVTSDFTVLVDGKSIDVALAAESVADVVSEAGVVLGEDDVVEPALTTRATGDMVIDIHRVTIEEEIRETELAYSVETKKDSTIVSGDKLVVRPVADDSDSENESTASFSTAPNGRTCVKVLTCKATAYHEPEGSLTKSGTLSRVGAIAVDPGVIPLGTELYVEGYGYCVAEDTGGLIKGNRIDIYLDSEAECVNWGVRDVTVYILE